MKKGVWFIIVAVIFATIGVCRIDAKNNDPVINGYLEANAKTQGAYIDAMQKNPGLSKELSGITSMYLDQYEELIKENERPYNIQIWLSFVAASAMLIVGIIICSKKDTVGAETDTNC